jgi:hypothetical protein
MEETDVCYSTPFARALQQAIPNSCFAKTLGPGERLSLSVQALAGRQTVTDLAEDVGVSRKFVYQQANIAREALENAFAPGTRDDEVLFYLPVTKNWLKQVALGLTLNCHSSIRGVHEFCRDLLDVNMSIGTVHNIIHDAIALARMRNQNQNLAAVGIGGLDEIFQATMPVLVGADIRSTYCFLLSSEDQRDADTWAIRLLELKDRGFAPQATIADFGPSIHAAQKQVMPNVVCRGDVFHVLHEARPIVSYLENRAYEAIKARTTLQRQSANKQKKTGRYDQSLGQKAHLAILAEAKAIAYADDVALLIDWLRFDVLAVSALPYADRCALFDFIVAELQTRAPAYPKRIHDLCTLLRNHRLQILAFAELLDSDLADFAKRFEVPLDLVRQLFDLQHRDPRQASRWQEEQTLRQKLGKQFPSLNAAVRWLRKQVVRASSIVENLNSRLRAYFFLRRHLGKDFLPLLQFYLNHHCFLRSEHPERKGKSPAELLTGQSHPHWLEMLGYRRFRRFSSN